MFRSVSRSVHRNTHKINSFRKNRCQTNYYKITRFSYAIPQRLSQLVSWNVDRNIRNNCSNFTFDLTFRPRNEVKSGKYQLNSSAGKINHTWCWKWNGMKWVADETPSQNRRVTHMQTETRRIYDRERKMRSKRTFNFHSMRINEKQETKNEAKRREIIVGRNTQHLYSYRVPLPLSAAAAVTATACKFDWGWGGTINTCKNHSKL